MAISSKKGTFAAPLVTGNQAVTGVGFQPKALVLFGVNATIDGFSVGHAHSIAVISGTTTNQQVATTSGDDAVASTNTARRDQNAAYLVTTDGSGTISGAAGFVSFDADGFTLNWTSAPGSTWQVHYLALGGTDLVNAKVGTWTAPAATGIQAVTGVGFTPDCVLHFGNTTSTAQATTEASMNFTMGCATGVGGSREWSCAIASADAQATSIPASIFLETEGLVHISSTTGAVLSRAKFAGFTPDGFLWNWTVSGTSGARQLYLALETGRRCRAGVASQRTSAGTQATTGIGAQPVALLVAGTNKTTSGTINTTAEANLVIGATDGTAEGHIWDGHSDATTTQDVNKKTSTTKLLSHNANPSTLQAEADLQSFDSDGFTLNWTTADASARVFGFLAITSAARTAPPQLYGNSAATAAGGLYIGTAGTTVTPVNPTHAANDILVCVASHHVAATLSISAGWTAFAPAGDTNPLSNANQSSGFWWKRAASAAESNPVVTSSVTLTTTNSLQAQVFRVRGCVTTGNPFEGADLNASTAAAAASTTAATLAVTPTAAQRLVVSFLLRDDDPAPSSGLPPSGWALQSNISTTTGGDVRFIAIARESYDTTTVAAATIATWAAAVVYRSLTVAFIPVTTGAIVTVQALVGATSTVTAAAARRKTTGQVLVGSASTVTVTGPIRRRAVQPLVAAASTVIAVVSRLRLTGQVLVGSSSSVVAAPGRRKVTGQVLVGSSSSVTAAPGRGRVVQVLVAGASTVTVAVVRRRAVQILVAAASSVVAAPTRRRAVQALVSGASSVSAAVGRIRLAAALVGAQSTVTAAVARIRAAGGLPGYAQEVAADSPVLWWRMEDGAPANGDLIADAGSMGLAGVVNGSSVSAVAHPRSLPYANGYEVDATVGGAMVAATAPAASLPSSAVSVECWYRTDYAVNWHNVIAHDWGAFANPGWLLHLSTTAVVFGVWHTSGQKTAAKAMSYADGQWHHYVGVYDPAGSGGTGQVRLYIDGVLEATAGGVGVYTLDDAGSVAVAASTTSTAGLKRAIAEAAVYGTALSDARVAAHYAAGRRTGLSVSSASTVTVTVDSGKRIAATVSAAAAVAAAVVRRRVTGQVLVGAASTVTVATSRRKLAGPALVASSSTVTAAVARRKVTGQVLVGAAGAVTAAVVRRRAVAALVASSSSVVVTTARRRAVAALVAGASTVTVATRRFRSVSAVVASASTVTVHVLGGIRAIAPTVSSSSTVTVSSARRRSAAAVVSASSTVTVASTRRFRTIAPLVAASSTVAVANAQRSRAVVVDVSCSLTVQAVPSVPVAVLVTFVQPVYP